MSKSKYIIKKTNRVLKFKGVDSSTYITWKVTGPKGFKKYFVTKKDAQAFVKRFTDTSVTTDMLADIVRGR